MKKATIWKYVLVAALVLVVVYAVVQVTRENFATANPLPTVEDFNRFDTNAGKIQDGLMAKYKEKLPPSEVLETERLEAYSKNAPRNLKKLYDYIMDNVLPLIPPEAYPYVPTETQKKMNTWMMLVVLGPKFIPKLADMAEQSPSAPDFSAWVDQVASQVIPEWVNNPAGQKLIPLTKSYTSTINIPAGYLAGPNDTRPAATVPNPMYWLYRYIYGNPPSMGSKVVAPTNPASKPGSCNPSVKSVPGGFNETKCFN